MASPATAAHAAATPGSSVVLAVVFTSTAFIGAGLLFVVQPMVARLVLPSYGGSATVWSTSSLFFQVLLLLGYLYTHLSTRRLGLRQIPFHLLVLVAPLLVLPVALPIDAVPPPDASPVPWLLRMLAVMIGLPFVVVSTTGPLLQRWYSWTGGPRADDPYFMFAASNVGSFGGLLAYPFLIEPNLTLEQQRSVWSWGFVLLAGLVASCGLATVTRGRRRTSALASESTTDGTRPVRPSHTEPGLPVRQVARWIALAFVPSAMMLAVTSHVSTDIAAIPLLWVVPLAIYLATFVAAFARSSRVVPRAFVRLGVGLTLAALVASSLSPLVPTWVDVALNMTMLAVVSSTAHARLAADRPPVAQLTAYYLVISVGGALGGLLNGLVAPLVLDRVLEYHVVAIGVPLVLVERVARTVADAPKTAGRRRASQPNRLRRLAAVLGGVPLVMGAVGLAVKVPEHREALLVVGIFVVLGLGWAIGLRRVESAAVLGAVLVVALVVTAPGTLERGRTFFGSYRVAASDEQHTFLHGTTVHGTQYVDGRRTEPTTYYARSGPLGDVFSLPDLEHVAAVGLGAGTIAAYGRPGQRLAFVEIDPEVVRIARDERLFTYLRDSRAEITVAVGDGRLEVARLAPASLDLLVLDAFSSDSIPVHLLTREAMRVYASRLRPGGIMAVHISNRVFDLRPVVRAAADDLGLVAVLGRGVGGEDSSLNTDWVVVGDEAATSALLARQGWSPVDVEPVVWTDDYSSVLSVLR